MGNLSHLLVSTLLSHPWDLLQHYPILNNFTFDGISYLQKKGCAMGSKYTLSYATLFMVWFEEHFNYPLILRFSKFYLWCIDDIFLIWNKTKKKELKTIIQKVNNCHPTSKFWYEISKPEINTSLARQFWKLLINYALNFILNKLINNLIYIANQKTPVSWRIVLHIVKLCIWIKFATTRVIYKTTKNYLWCKYNIESTIVIKYLWL